MTKLEENVIALLEKNEHIITNDQLGSTYQQVCNTINWLNEQMINIEPRCLLVYIEPEMSSHYFRNAETTDFFYNSASKPCFFQGSIPFERANAD